MTQYFAKEPSLFTLFHFVLYLINLFVNLFKQVGFKIFLIKIVKILIVIFSLKSLIVFHFNLS